MYDYLIFGSRLFRAVFAHGMRVNGKSCLMLERRGILGECVLRYTRIIEHKHFEFGTQPVTYVTKEYPADWQSGEEAYYPVNDDHNQAICQRYQELAAREYDVIFGGRLAEYKYYDMDDVIKSALEKVAEVCD